MEVTLKEFLEKTIHDLEKRIVDMITSQDRFLDSALKANENSVKIALIEIDKRLTSMNEFRSELGDRARDLMPRNEVEALFNAQAQVNLAQDKRLLALENTIAAMANKGVGQGQVVAWIITAIALVGSILAIASRFW